MEISTKNGVLSFTKFIVPGTMRSSYWKHFGFPGDSRGEIVSREKVVCTLCNKQMSYKGNTSNLRTHLQHQHFQHYLALEGHIESTPDKVLKKKTTYKSKLKSVFKDTSGINLQTDTDSEAGVKLSISVDKDGSPNFEYIARDASYFMPQEVLLATSNTVESAVVCFLATELISPSIVESSGFHHFVSKLVTSPVSFPTAKRLEQEVIPPHVIELKQNLFQELKECQEYSLTVEHWLNFRNEDYITISINFSTKNEFKSRVGPTIKWNSESPDVIKSALSDWNIAEEKITAIVVASANDSLLDTLSGIAPTLPCFLFIIQIAVESCFNLPEVAQLINKCRAVQDSVSNSDGKNFIIDNPVYWLSTYEMLENIVEAKTAFEHVLCDEWHNLTTLVELFFAFRITVQTLQEEKPPFISIIQPLLNQLRTNYFEEKNSDSDLVKELKFLLQSQLAKAYCGTTVNKLLQTASCLDPRFRHLQTTLDAVDENATKDQIKAMLTDIIAENQESTEPAPSHTKRLSGMAMLLGGACTSKCSVSPGNKAEVEFTQYCNEDIIAFEQNPLNWWKNVGVKYPNMKRLVQKYLCIPASVVPFNRIAVVQRERFEQQRAILRPNFADPMLFLNSIYTEKI